MLEILFDMEFRTGSSRKMSIFVGNQNLREKTNKYFHRERIERWTGYVTLRRNNTRIQLDPARLIMKKNENLCGDEVGRFIYVFHRFFFGLFKNTSMKVNFSENSVN